MNGAPGDLEALSEMGILPIKAINSLITKGYDSCYYCLKESEARRTECSEDFEVIKTSEAGASDVFHSLLFCNPQHHAVL